MTYDAVPTIRQEADAFLAAACRGLDEPVPGCPDWDVRELTQHLAARTASTPATCRVG